MKSIHNKEHYEVIAKDQSWKVIIERSSISHDLWFCSINPKLMTDAELKELLDNYKSFDCTVIHQKTKEYHLDKNIDSIECGRVSGDRWLISYSLIRSDNGFVAEWNNVIASWAESRVFYELDKRKRLGDTIRYFDKQGNMIDEEKK